MRGYCSSETNLPIYSSYQFFYDVCRNNVDLINICMYIGVKETILSLTCVRIRSTEVNRMREIWAMLKLTEDSWSFTSNFLKYSSQHFFYNIHKDINVNLIFLICIGVRKTIVSLTCVRKRGNEIKRMREIWVLNSDGKLLVF